MNKKVLKEYLESWLDNVGRSSSDEETLSDAMTDSKSLIEWGLLQDQDQSIDYDWEYAINIIKNSR